MDNQNLHLSTGQLETGPVQGSWAEKQLLIICRAFVENQPNIIWFEKRIWAPHIRWEAAECRPKSSPICTHFTARRCHLGCRQRSVYIENTRTHTITYTMCSQYL